MYPKEYTLNKANITSDSCQFYPFQGNVNTRVYHRRDNFSFPIVNFHILDGDVPLVPLNGVYILQLVRFARFCNHVSDFNDRNLVIT